MVIVMQLVLVFTLKELPTVLIVQKIVLYVQVLALAIVQVVDLYNLINIT